MNSIRDRIKSNHNLLAQLLFTGLSFLAMAVISYLFMTAIVRSNLIRGVHSVMDSTQERILSTQEQFESTIESFASAASGIILEDGTTEMMEDYIDDIARFKYLDGKTDSGIVDLYGYFETLPGGPVLIRSGISPIYEGFNPELQEWYAPALEAGGGIVQTVPRIIAGECRYTYAKCILDGQGRQLGIVCLDVQIDILGNAVVEMASNQGGHGMLIGQDELVLAHPRTVSVGKHMSDPNFPPSVFVDEIRAGQDITEEPLVDYQGNAAIAYFRRLPNGWYLGFVMPKNEYYQSMSSMALIFTALSIIFAVILIGILIRIDNQRARSHAESRQKSIFLANMSHEIRTPINAIVGMTAIGKASGNVDRKDYCFAKIDDASRHLLGVINDILDISKIEANKIELSNREFNFEKMLQDVVNVINYRIDEKSQKLTVYIDKAIPRTLIADDQRFSQVVTNLLGNAVKFTPDKGHIGLRATYMGDENGICTIKIDVSDTGIGIYPEQRSRLFTSFQQAESSTTRRYGGTGLGLVISKSIVELMGGEIWFDSVPGEKTVFSFTVKARRGEDVQNGFGYQFMNWGNVRILAVDDEVDVLDYFTEILSGSGANCDVAISAREALGLIERIGAYNIYFIDLKMPEMDGIELTRRIRAQEEIPGSSIVIMISSADLSAVEQEAKQAGVNKFLLKPLFPSSITDIIRECIGIVNEKYEEEALPDVNGLFNGHCVLLAEDMEINREIVISLMEPTGLAIDCAENGMEAVQMFMKAPDKYDMIYMDIQMPEMDGFEAARQIRALSHPKARTVPIVAMTANVFKEDIESSIEAGMDGHLGKPTEFRDMLEVTCKYLGVPVRKL